MRFLLISALFLSAVYLSQSRAIVTYDETVKDDLKNQIDNLKKQALDAMHKLIDEGKGALANEINNVVLETQLLLLESQLKKLDPQTEAGKALLKNLEALVKGAETKLQDVIKKVTGASYDETAKDDLKNQIDNLKKQAQDAIQKLMGEGKTVLAEEIEKVENKLLDLKTQLNGWENMVKFAEGKPEEEVKNLTGTTTDVLKAQVKALKKQAQAEIEKLKLSLEALIKRADTKLEDEVKKLSGGFYNATTDELKNQVQNLKWQALYAIQKLMAEGKGDLANEINLVVVETHLPDLESQLKKLDPQTEAGKALLKSLEPLVKVAETKLQDVIKKVTGGSYDEIVKDDLKNQIDNLKKKTLVMVENIDKVFKGNLYLKTTVGRTLYLETEKVVKQIEALLQMYKLAQQITESTITNPGPTTTNPATTIKPAQPI